MTPETLPGHRLCPMIRSALVWVLMLLAACWLSGCAVSKPIPPAQGGVKDLRMVPRMPSGGFTLSGQWEFYWQRHLTPGDFAGPTPPAMTGYIAQPQTWRGYATPQGKLPGTGYATYRLLLRFPEGGWPGDRARIFLREADTSYRLYLADRQGRLLAKPVEGGKAGTTPATAFPLYRPGRLDFVPKGDVQVVLQVSNFVHPRGGSANTIEVDSAEAMTFRHGVGLYVDLFLIGGSAVMGLYCLVLYALRPVDRAPLWFGIACVLAAGRQLIRGRYLESLVPEFYAYHAYLFFEYVTLYGVVPVILMFLASLFPSGYSKRQLLVMVGIGEAFLLLVTLTSPLVYAHSLLWFEGYVVIAVGWGVWGLIKVVRAKHDGHARFILISQLVVAVFAVNDVLHHNHVIQTTYLFGFTFLSMIFGMSFVLASVNQHARNEVEAHTLRLEKLVELYENASREAVTDQLTGLHNRRGFQELYKQIAAEARRYQHDLTLVLFDIDHFKRFNDTYGHAAGDAVIQAVAGALEETVRDSDVTGRWGGEEFIALLPQTNLQGGVILAERIRKAVEGLTIDNPEGGLLPPVTVSLGVAALAPDDQGLDTLTAKADQALYQAKQQGRNQVQTFEVAV